MAEKYYLDTSIWLDFFEKRNMPNLPKGDWAHKLLEKITKNNDKAILVTLDNHFKSLPEIIKPKRPQDII